MILTERTGLEMIFHDLQQEKRELKANYRMDLEAIEKRQFEVLDRLQRLDDTDRGQAADAIKEVFNLESIGESVLHKEGVMNRLAASIKETQPEIAPSYLHAAKKVEEKQPDPEPDPDPQAAAPAPIVEEADETPPADFKQPGTVGWDVLNKLKEQMESGEPEAEQPEPVAPKYTGTKERNGETLYQVFYICTNKRCGHKGKRFIPKNQIDCFCHSCGHTMRVRPAADAFPQQDGWGNFFVAGNKRTSAEEKAIQSGYENPVERIETALDTYKAAQQEAKEHKKQQEPKPRRSGRAAAIHRKEAEQRAHQSEDQAAQEAAATREIKPARGKIKSKDVVAAMELVLEEQGPSSWKHLEEEFKKQFGWEWSNFYNMMNRSLRTNKSRVVKNGRRYELEE